MITYPTVVEANSKRCVARDMIMIISLEQLLFMSDVSLA